MPSVKLDSIELEMLREIIFKIDDSFLFDTTLGVHFVDCGNFILNLDTRRKITFAELLEKIKNT